MWYLFGWPKMYLRYVQGCSNKVAVRFGGQIIFEQIDLFKKFWGKIFKNFNHCFLGKKSFAKNFREVLS